MKNKIAVAIATVFGVGCIPIMPGTFGTCVVLPFFYLCRNHFLLFLCIFLFLLMISVPVCHQVSHKWGEKDPQKIVLDEFLGFMLALFFAKPVWMDCLCLFVLFRFFDISKIGPVALMENYPKGWGIILDDLCAGLLAGLLWIFIKKGVFYVL